jgi:3-hydroxybutyryl-CoA dehydrogenase
MLAVVVGIGRMGSQIALEHALGGIEVVAVARRAGAAEAALDRAAAVVERHGLATSEALAAACNRIAVVTDSEDVDGTPEVVVDAMPEDLLVKVEALRVAAARWPDATIASNTSSLPIGRIGAAIDAAERTVGTHYWNPPLLMPLVEVIAGPYTSTAVVERTEALLAALGKRPVRVARDVPGFIWNRLQFALLREALWIVDEGVATPDAIDAIVRDGLARRWQLTGPFETAELGGVQTFAAIADGLFAELSTARSAPTLARWRPREPGALATAERRRDAGLARALRDEVPTTGDHWTTVEALHDADG